MVTPSVRAFSRNADVSVAVHVSTRHCGSGDATPFTNAAASVFCSGGIFPVANLTRAESTAAAPFEAVLGQLQKLGTTCG